jgi:hypothetical protein
MLLTRRAVLAGLTAAIWSAPIRAAETPQLGLVMYRRVGCPWCKAWDRDIGAIYPRTDLGERLPLREVDIRDGDGGFDLARPVRYTPTFVLVEGARELARIEGYPGEDFFWVRLELLADEHAPSESRAERPNNQHSEEPHD